MSRTGLSFRRIAVVSLFAWLWLTTAGALQHNHELRPSTGSCISSGATCIECQWLTTTRTPAVVTPAVVFEMPLIDLGAAPAEVRLPRAVLSAFSSRGPPTA